MFSLAENPTQKPTPRKCSRRWTPEEFVVVNDHDPSPLARMLAGEFDGRSAEAVFETFGVHRRGPDEWVLEVERAV